MAADPTPLPAADPARTESHRDETKRKVFLLVDGENIDMTLGQYILGGRPKPEERPRWERVLRMVEARWGTAPRGLFFLNVSRGMPWSFLTALRSLGLVPIPLTGKADQKVVDIGIERTLEALRERRGDVMLCSHDADFAAGLAKLADGERRLGVLGFEEYVSSDLRDVPGVEVLDLEWDAGAFECGPLPRLRAVPIDEFDPTRYLD
jgi:uncharacterized protein